MSDAPPADVSVIVEYPDVLMRIEKDGEMYSIRFSKEAAKKLGEILVGSALFITIDPDAKPN